MQRCLPARTGYDARQTDNDRNFPRRMSSDNSRTALFLPAAARAAYQAGVLAAIRDMLPDATVNPFPILCGTSAGAINAATLACQADNFRAAVESLNDVWRNMRARDVYRADTLGVAASGGALAGIAGTRLGDPQQSALAARQRSATPAPDPPPRLRQHRPQHRQRHAARGVDYRLRLYQWPQRQLLPGTLRNRIMVAYPPLRQPRPADGRTPDGLGGDSLVFPATRLHREWFGDGSMRQVAPVSPAIHLGAEKILVIGAGRMSVNGQRQRGNAYRRWRRLPAMRCRRFFWMACRSTSSACSASTTPCR